MRRICEKNLRQSERLFYQCFPNVIITQNISFHNLYLWDNKKIEYLAYAASKGTVASPHRLAALATSPVATGEAKIGEPRKGTETRADSVHRQRSLSHLRTRTPRGDGAYLQPPLPERGSGQRHPITLRWCSCSWDVFPYDLLPNQLRPVDLLLGQVSKGDRASGGRGTKKRLLHEVCDFMQQPLGSMKNLKGSSMPLLLLCIRS